MTKIKSGVFARLALIVLALALIAPLAVSAATVTSGNLTLGDPRPSQTSTVSFSASGFTTGTTIRCVALRLNTAADGGGSAVGTTTGSTLSANTLLTTGTWTVNNTNNGILRITNATGDTPESSGSVTWGGVVNGATPNTTYYGLFSTYTNQDCLTGPVDTTTVAFTYTDGALVSLIVDPTLTFTVAGVASAQTVNSATTNITTTATAINFARTATASVKGVAAHDLTVATNAANGFTVNLRQTGGLTNGSYTIPALSGATNAAPTAFSAAGTEAWGYTTADSSLAGGTATRFTTPGNYWAGMPTTNELVMDASASGSQTTRVGQQLGISSTTPAGNYSTTIVYTAAGVY